MSYEKCPECEEEIWFEDQASGTQIRVCNKCFYAKKRGTEDGK